MEHYVTLFDSVFLPQGVALQMSMERHLKDYTLWIVCVDSKAHEVLTRLQLPNVRLINIDEVETDELRQVKVGRSRGEYCWTLTPFSHQFVFNADSSVMRVTYLDADVWFRGSPARLFEELELSGKQVLITDHGYAPEYDQSHKTGKYCVQFVSFVREGGEPVRNWWADRCLEWCFARSESDRFGDQKYLDRWPLDFSKLVHVCSQLDAIQAPWNAKRFPPSSALAYHFHGLRIMKHKKVQITDHYHIPRSTFEIIYKPYLEDISKALIMLENAGHQVMVQTSANPWQVRARAIALRWRALWLEWSRPDITRINKV
jgi:hypothetical protein